MKVAVSSTGEGLDSQVDMRFGRCNYFVIVEVDDNNIKKVQVVHNEGAMQAAGAGPVAAQQVGNLSVDKIITGNLGPNAYNIISQLGIEVYQASGTVEEAVKQLLEGKLNKITETVPPHFGMGRDMGPGLGSGRGMGAGRGSGRGQGSGRGRGMGSGGGFGSGMGRGPGGGSGQGRGMY